ncbi:hypothetical protein F1640_03330 [Novosphingobium sp. NBM11]|uniref:hypothetical protein n=1 Tax=Novosphingobium sp. NBM11 TaxID=2596914 RepID=UPI0018924269|nr:hypothetical protein [Novosphingobium sp. NBM11]MBF5089081.1 hypothetical protein [Novosphingobium sp. NBM11]
MNNEFHFRSGSAANLACDGAYLDCIDRVSRAPDGQGIFWFDGAWLAAHGATLILAEQHDNDGQARFAGGLYLTEPEPGAIYIGGAVVDTPYRGHGLLKQLVARGRLQAGEVAATAVVRVYPDGRVNLPSLLSLAVTGVSTVVGLGRGTFQNSPYDRHLKPSLEADGRTFRYLTLTSGASLDASRAVVAGVSNR